MNHDLLAVLLISVASLQLDLTSHQAPATSISRRWTNLNPNSLPFPSLPFPASNFLCKGFPARLSLSIYVSMSYLAIINPCRDQQ